MDGFKTVNGFVNDKINWCACGMPDRVDEMMLAYLKNLHERWEEGKGWHPTPGISEDTELLLCYMADALGWTVHGGAVTASWLSIEGEAILQELEEFVGVPDVIGPS